MSAASFAEPGRRRALWGPLPAKARVFFVRLRGWFGTMRDCSWAFAGQPEHLVAYAMWSEIACDDEEKADVAASPDARRMQ